MDRTIKYIDDNREEIENGQNIEEHKKNFDSLYTNEVSEDYSDYMVNNTWVKIYDDSI